MAVNTALNHSSGSISTTADTLQFTRKIRQVVIQNNHATQVIYVKCKTGATAAAALAAAAADDAVADADECVQVAGGKRVTVWQSSKPTYFAASIIATVGATTYSADGTAWIG